MGAQRITTFSLYDQLRRFERDTERGEQTQVKIRRIYITRQTAEFTVLRYLKVYQTTNHTGLNTTKFDEAPIPPSYRDASEECLERKKKRVLRRHGWLHAQNRRDGTGAQTHKGRDKDGMV